jgi:hypothetical protein
MTSNGLHPYFMLDDKCPRHDTYMYSMTEENKTIEHKNMSKVDVWAYKRCFPIYSIPKECYRCSICGILAYDNSLSNGFIVETFVDGIPVVYGLVCYCCLFDTDLKDIKFYGIGRRNYSNTVMRYFKPIEDLTINNSKRPEQRGYIHDGWEEEAKKQEENQHEVYRVTYHQPHNVLTLAYDGTVQEVLFREMEKELIGIICMKCDKIVRILPHKNKCVYKIYAKSLPTMGTPYEGYQMTTYLCSACGNPMFDSMFAHIRPTTVGRINEY